MEQKEIFDLLKKGIEDLMPANKILGLQIEELKEGFALIKVPFKDEFIGDFLQERWHGGILASIADTAGGIAGATMLSAMSDRINTVDMRIDYLRGAKKGDVKATAKVIKNGKTIVKVDIQLFQDQKDDPIAVARCVYSVLKSK
ncbi:PaaI family thioesterase [Ekhidna sp.]|uniref:PaaI family thioesterase n=1 Tax=Ekhidna sp. TaxID=2608089 RepID=UPI00351211F9